MSTPIHVALSRTLLALACTLVQPPCLADDAQAPTGPESALTATGSYYSLPHEPDFGVGVVTYDRESLHLEARYNYEVRNAASAFVGWSIAGGNVVRFEATPIVGVLVGGGGGVIPGVEATVTYREFDAYVEAEYVSQFDDHSASYLYAWSELGWTPVRWLRIGLVGQRTRVVETDQDFERGLFAQVTAGKAKLAVYAFNPGTGSRYLVASVGISF